MRSNPSSALQMGNKWKAERVKALNLLSEAWLHWWRGRGEDESLTRCSGMMWRCTGTGMWLNCENPANKQEKQDELLNHTFTVSHSGMSTQFPAWLLFLNSLSEGSFLNTYAVHSAILPQHGRWRVFSAILLFPACPQPPLWVVWNVRFVMDSSVSLLSVEDSHTTDGRATVFMH